MKFRRIIIFNGDNGEVNVQIDAVNETIWLTQKSLAQLFGVTPQNITLHLRVFMKMENCKKLQLVRNAYKFK